MSDVNSIIDMKNEEIKILKEHIKNTEEMNHELWEMNNILETSLKGYDRIISEYPTLKKKLEIIQKEFEYGLPTSMKECAYICSKIHDLMENKK